MRFKEWIKKEGRGSITEVSHRTRLSYTKVWQAAQGFSVSRYQTARLISEATGGEVSIEELCEPDGEVE